MIKLVRIPLLYGALICGMSGAASAQSVPFYPTARQTDYAVGIPGTYDHVSASSHPEYNLSGGRRGAARHSADRKTGHTGTQAQDRSYPDFRSFAKTAPAGG
jgi:hypothetical protein